MILTLYLLVSYGLMVALAANVCTVLLVADADLPKSTLWLATRLAWRVVASGFAWPLVAPLALLAVLEGARGR